MAFIKALAKRYPELEKDMRKAGISDRSKEDIIQNAVKQSLIYGICLTVLYFMLADSQGWNLLTTILVLPISIFGIYKYILLNVKSKVLSRKKRIDEDVLFTGRYLLVKLNSGQPLISAIIEASKGEGNANKYLKDIVRDIKTGKPVEQAIKEGAKYSPSDKMKKILFQISNALEIGIDVTEFLEATLEEIAEQQILEIQRYGKKLNSVTLFYMLAGVVFPSLGFTIFIVIAGLTGFETNWILFSILLGSLAFIQFVFIIVYKQIRPNINI